MAFSAVSGTFRKMTSYECVDWLLVLGRHHLERVLRTYAAHYNEARPHRGLELKTPEPQLDSRARPVFGWARSKARSTLGSHP
jgi:Integrase core domain